MRRRLVGIRRALPNGGTRVHRVWRKWPHDTLAVGYWYDVEDPDDWQVARNAAYQHGGLFGKTYSCNRVYVDGVKILRITRIA